MKPRPALLRAIVVSLFAMTAATRALSAAEDARTPLPRARLDSSRHAVAPTPVASTAITASTKKENENGNSAANSTVVMEKMVVKAAPLLRSDGPPLLPPPPEKFNALQGGGFVKKDAGGIRFAAGLWPHEDIFAADARFKSPPRPVSFDLIRMSW